MSSQPTDDGVRIFLSYAREDFDAVSAIYDRLAALGLKPWMDARDIVGGQQWKPTILRAIRASHLFFSILSSKSVDKRGFLQKELAEGLDVFREKLEEDIYIIPIRLDECPVPEQIRPFQWVDFFKDGGWQSLLRSIVYQASKLGLSLPTGSEDGFDSPRLLEAQNLLVDVLDRIDYLYHFPGIRTVPTGFRLLDSLLGGGLERGQLTLIAALPGMGKTSLALSIARNAVLHYDKTVAVYSLEHDPIEVLMRMLAATTRIDTRRLRQGTIGTEDEWHRIITEVENLARADLYIFGAAAVTMNEMHDSVQRFRKEHQLDLVVVDALQLIAMEAPSYSEAQDFGMLCRPLKKLAKEFDVPVIVVSDLSRTAEKRADKRPILRDLSEYGSIEEYTDVVLFIYRPEMYDDASELANIADVIIAKHSNGSKGIASLHFCPQLGSFTDPKTNYGETE